MENKVIKKSKPQPSVFENKVYEFIKNIPKGRVTTYKDIAIAIGCTGGARAVGNALHKKPTPIIVPCHRVVNYKGLLATNFGLGGLEGQKHLLINEGVEVVNHKVDLKKYSI